MSFAPLATSPISGSRRRVHTYICGVCERTHTLTRTYTHVFDARCKSGLQVCLSLDQSIQSAFHVMGITSKNRNFPWLWNAMVSPPVLSFFPFSALVRFGVAQSMIWRSQMKRRTRRCRPKRNCFHSRCKEGGKSQTWVKMRSNGETINLRKLDSRADCYNLHSFNVIVSMLFFGAVTECDCRQKYLYSTVASS